MAWFSSRRFAVESIRCFTSSRGWMPKTTPVRRIAAAVIGPGLGYIGTTALCEAKAAESTKDSNTAQNELVDISNLQQWDFNWDSRHGHYYDRVEKEADMKLTPLGRQQARIMARNIALMPWTPSRLVVSDMTRARETFEILKKELQLAERDAPTLVLPSLREGRPCQPIPPSKSGLYKQAAVDRDGARINEAFLTLFHRADVDQKEDSFDVVVGHANVIRYFVCKALQLPTEAWLRIGLAHCSVTVLALHPSGFVSLRSLGNTHDLPPALVSYS